MDAEPDKKTVQEKKTVENISWKDLKLGTIALSVSMLMLFSVTVYDYVQYRDLVNLVDQETEILDYDSAVFEKQVAPIVQNMRSKPILAQEDFDIIRLKSMDLPLSHKFFIDMALLSSMKNRLTSGTYNQDDATGIDPVTDEEIAMIKKNYQAIISDLEKQLSEVEMDLSKYPNRITSVEEITNLFEKSTIPIIRIPTVNKLEKHYAQQEEFFKKLFSKEAYEAAIVRALPLKNLLDYKDLKEYAQQLHENQIRNEKENNIPEDVILSFNQDSWDKLYAPSFGETMSDWFKLSNPTESESKLANKTLKEKIELLK